MGVGSGVPNKAAVEEKTKRGTLWWRTASSSVSELAVLLWKYCSGNFMDSPASIAAARCTTPSMRWSVKMRSGGGRSEVSPTTSLARGGTADLWPLLRLSKTMTSKPFLRSWEVITLPMYPAPPVTSTRSGMCLWVPLDPPASNDLLMALVLGRLSVLNYIKNLAFALVRKKKSQLRGDEGD